MKTLYFSINPNHQNLILGNLFQFLFVILLALFIWCALYKLLSEPQTRRWNLKYLKAMPRIWAFTIGGGISLLIIGYIYVDNWVYFFQIDMKHSNLHLHYFLPKRSVIISTETIKEFDSKEEWRKTKQYRLIIRTKNGKEYKSAFIDSNLFQKNMKELQQQLVIRN